MDKDGLKRWDISKIFRIKKYPFKFREGDIEYYQEKNGFCSVKQYDSKKRIIAYETSDGVFIGREYDEEGNIIRIMDAKAWEREQLLNFLLEEK
jgi:hypothetical protein